MPVRGQFKKAEDTQSLHDEENLVILLDIIPTSESIEEEVEDTDPHFIFNAQKASKRISKIIQRSENKPQGIKRVQRNELLGDMEFSLIKNLSDSKKKRKTEEENADNLFCKSLAAGLKEIPLYERLNTKRLTRRVVF